MANRRQSQMDIFSPYFPYLKEKKTNTEKTGISFTFDREKVTMSLRDVITGFSFILKKENNNNNKIENSIILSASAE